MSAHRIFGIAQLTLRDAVRSRLFLSLAVLLVLACLGLPLTVQGDGTLLGRCHVVLRYTFGAASVLLSVATLWVSCGLVAGEIADRRIHLVLTKPVSLAELWLGKWLGVMAVNGGLLLLAVALIAGAMQWTLRPPGPAGGDGEHAALVDRAAGTYERILPRTAGLDERVEARLREWRAGAGADADPESRARQAIRAALLRADGTAAPGQAVRWQFPGARPPVAGKPAYLVFAAAASLPFGTAAPGTWRLSEGRSGHTAQADYALAPGLPNVLGLPQDLLTGGELTIEFTNAATNPPMTVVFEPDRMEVRVWHGGLLPNLVRAALALFCRLGFLAALGLVAGSLLSLPVAVFATFAALLILALGPYIRSVAATGVFYVPHEGHLPEPTLVDAAVKAVFRVVDQAVRPVLALDPGPLVAENTLVPWSLVGRAAATLLGLYAGLLSALGLLLLRRRELAR